MKPVEERRAHPTQPEADYIRASLAILGEPETGLDKLPRVSEDRNTVVPATDASKPSASCAPPAREVAGTTGAQQTEGFSFVLPRVGLHGLGVMQYMGLRLALEARPVAFPLRLHETAAGDTDKAAIDESGCQAEPGTNQSEAGPREESSRPWLTVARRNV